jgi:hypothetical protein
MNVMNADEGRGRRGENGALYLPASTFHLAAEADGAAVLSGLETLGRVGVEIVFPVESAAPVDLAAERKSEPYSVFYRLPIEAGQGTWVGEADDAGMSVGRTAKGGRVGAERFTTSTELDVGLEANDGFVSQVLLRYFKYDCYPNCSTARSHSAYTVSNSAFKLLYFLILSPDSGRL